MNSGSAQVALLYPGQGAYSPGLLRRLVTASPAAATQLQRVRTTWLQERGEDLDLVTDDAQADIGEIARRSLGLSQVAIFATSIAMHAALGDDSPEDVVHVGHSFGEIAALTSAGAWSVEDGTRVVAARVRALEQVSGSGGMTAVSGDSRRAAALVAAAGAENLVVAGHNGPGQVVVSGPVADLERFEAAAAALAISTTRLSSPYAFHSPVLREAAERFGRAVREIGWSPATRPVYSPILGRYYAPEDDLAHLVAGHLTDPFDFGAAVSTLVRDGRSIFVELGGRSALTSGVRRTLQAEPTATTAPWVAVAGDTEPPLAAAREALGAAPAPSGGAGIRDLDLPALVQTLREALRGDIERLVSDRLTLVASTASPATAPAGPALVAVEPAETPGTPADSPDASWPADSRAEGIADADSATSSGPDASAPPVDRPAVMAELVTLYSDALEYPREVFEEDVELEGDLGVDSVKQTELLARAADRFGLPPQPSGFAIGKFPTLGHIADLVLESVA